MRAEDAPPRPPGDSAERADREGLDDQGDSERRPRDDAEPADREGLDDQGDSERRNRAQRARENEDKRREDDAAARRAAARGHAENRPQTRPTSPTIREILPTGSEFDLSAPLPIGQRVVLEASAGTGKTFSLTSLVARYVAEEDLAINELLMVTFTKAAAAEMRERTRAKLTQALVSIEGNFTDEQMGGDRSWLAPIVECDPSERDARIRRLRAAITEIDSATITTIHGFFQQTLREIGLRSADVAAAEIGTGESLIGRQVLRDELIRRYANGDSSLSLAETDSTPADVEAKVLEVIRALDANISAVAAPHEACDDPIANQWAAFISQIRDKIRGRRLDTGVLSFDDLVTGMREVIDTTNQLSQAVLTTLRARYRLVLIDEFQDTDDIQWEIFSNVFDFDILTDESRSPRTDRPFLAMILVGDPKQAIYRFRGADIAAYLRAVGDSDVVKYEMKRNFRSDADLISALNRLFGAPVGEEARPSGFKFGDPKIAYVQVDAGKKGPGSLLSVGGAPDAAKPLQLRWIATDTTPKPTVDIVRPAIAEDLANHVALLLNDGAISQQQGGQESQRRIKPGDICVLIRNHADADPVVEALRRRSIPVVKSSVGNVTASPAVEQWRLLLSALASPNDSRRVKAAALSWFVGLSPETLLDEGEIARLAERCAEWGAQLIELGVIGFYQQLRADPDVTSTLFRTSDVDRRLTDLEHLAELLHRSTDAKPLPAASLLHALDDLIASSSEEEENLRRIESDAEAVQVMTMHASKGLEFPIVLVPYPKAPRDKGPSVYTHNSTRFVDAAPSIAWELGGLDKDQRKAIATSEVVGDELRIMYVAYTRARHQLVLWWANTHGMSSSPLARLLFGNHDDSTDKTTVPKNEGTRLSALVHHIGDSLVHLAELKIGEQPATSLVSGDTSPGTSGEALDFPPNARSNFSRQRWSFSTIARGLADGKYDEAIGRGRDEGSGHEPRDHASSSDVLPSYSNKGLFPMPANTRFGTLVHAVLEHVDPSSDSLHDDLRRQINRFGGELLDQIDIEELVNGLVAALHTPLGSFFDDVSLADIEDVDRLSEMEFHFTLCPQSRAASSRAIALAASSDSTSPFAAYFGEMAEKWDSGRDQYLGGLMTGSIDALLRTRNSEHAKFFVVDYKSNKLSFAGNPLDQRAYELDNMKLAMTHHNYPLQALLYCVALHRFLSKRIPDYDIDRDLGGAGYFFLRGMIGPTTPIHDGIPNGVFGWRPSNQTIQRVSRILEEGQP